jgi:ribosomal protein S16
MDNLSTVLMDILPAIVAAGGLLWSFSKQITRIEAQLQTLEHQVRDCKDSIESNRQGRIEVFGVINNSLKPRDEQASERLARVETRLNEGIAPSEVYTRLAKIEAELDVLK